MNGLEPHIDSGNVSQSAKKETLPYIYLPVLWRLMASTRADEFNRFQLKETGYWLNG